MVKKALIAALLAATGTATTTAFAAPITFTFTSVAADLSTPGSRPVDLVITLNADTANYVAAPTGPFSSSRYLGLGGTVSSVALGLSSVALASPLDLLINLSSAGFPSFVGITDGMGIAGLIAHPNTVGDLIVNWDRVSNFSATQMSNLSNDITLTLNLAGGGTVPLFRLDSDVGPGQDGGFSATLVTTPGTVPEPTAPALLLMALAASALVTRSRAS